MNKRIITPMLLFLLSGSGATCNADNDVYPFMTFETTEGEKTTVATEMLEMVFSGGNLLVRNNEQTLSMPLLSLKRMYFSEMTSGVENVISADDEGRRDVYTVGGMRLGGDAKTVKDGNAMPGIYLIKKGNVTRKVLER